MSASKPNPRDGIPLTKEREKDKGRRDATKKQHWALVRAHFFGNLFRSSPRDAIGGRTHSRARAKQSFARVRVSSCPPLFPRAPRFKEVPPPLSFPSKTSFFFDANLCLREEEKTKAKKRCILSRVGRSLGTRRRVTRTKKRRGRRRVERTGTRSAGKEERSSRGDGRGHVFFLLRFGAVRVKMCKVPFFSLEGKRKSEATTKKGFKVSSIFTP